MTEAECIFCKIVAGSAPGVRIYEDDSVIAILDLSLIHISEPTRPY